MAGVRGAIGTAVEGHQCVQFRPWLRMLQVKGLDVGASLISEGLAVRFVGGATSRPKLPRPWG